MSRVVPPKVLERTKVKKFWEYGANPKIFFFGSHLHGWPPNSNYSETIEKIIPQARDI